ncbi:hypothetical protein [Priestia abyssalis]|uniref:hypothetical protein n=1 Tax=Priestia abyssalis TaxID=1221450 RepID=UPI000994A148|nr:hypothetical protein [Priestia abyssalis]
MKKNYYRVYLYFTEGHRIEIQVQANSSSEIAAFLIKKKGEHQSFLTYNVSSDRHLVKRIVDLNKVLYFDIKKAYEFEYNSDDKKRRFHPLPLDNEILIKK